MQHKTRAGHGERGARAHTHTHTRTHTALPLAQKAQGALVGGHGPGQDWVLQERNSTEMPQTLESTARLLAPPGANATAQQPKSLARWRKAIGYVFHNSREVNNQWGRGREECEAAGTATPPQVAEQGPGVAGGRHAGGPEHHTTAQRRRAEEEGGLLAQTKRTTRSRRCKRPASART